jgi:uncharacterized protein YqeY
MDEGRPADTLRVRLRRDLTAAMKARRNEEVATIRTLMAAIDNAEAAGIEPPTSTTLPNSRDFAGAVLGIGSGDTPRRELDAAELDEILGAEIADRRAHEAQYGAGGRSDAAERMRREAELITRYRSNPDRR